MLEDKKNQSKKILRGKKYSNKKSIRFDRKNSRMMKKQKKMQNNI